MMKGRKLINRVVSWLMVLAMTLPLCLTNGMVVNAGTEKLADTPTYLCDLPVSSSKYGYEIDADVDGNVLTDTLYNTYEHGIGMHSNNDGNEATDGPRYVEYNLDKKYSRFTAELSINNACVANLDASWAKNRTIANVLVKIWVDNNSYDYTVDAKTMRAAGTATIEVDLDVSGAESLKIEVYQNAGDATCDATNIIEPKLYAVTEVAVTSDADSVKVGETLQFNADVAGDPEDKVTWSVAGNNSSDTKIEAGVLTVGEDETATSLIVKATSDYNENVYAESTVTVVNITSVTVNPTTAEVETGKTAEFSAVVSGDSTNAVTWSVAGNNSSDTKIEAGVLTVGEDETAASLTVTATSKKDSTKSGTATVTVKASTPAASNNYIWLCDLPVSSSKYGYEIDADVDGNVLTDTLYNTYEHGIGMHSNNDGNEATDGPRYVEYNLDKKYSRFTAELSINKACVANLDASWAKDRTIANVLVKIWVDNTSYDYTVDAKTMRAADTATIGVNLDVSGAESLKIEVYQNAGDATCDATNIIEPKLYFAGDIEKIYVNDAGNGIEFNAETLTYDVTGAETTLTKVSLKDANGNELPVPVTINSNGKVAEFTVNGKTYTVYYTDTTSVSYGPYMYLCDLIVSDSEGVYAVDANVGGDKKLIDANGKEYEHGLGMHSTRYVTYDLNGGYNRFTATFSPHKEVEEPSTGHPTYGVVSFQVYLIDSEDNETKVYDTGSLDIHDPSSAVVSCNIPIPTGTKKLKIVESDGNGYATCDSAIVADPKLYFNAEGIQLLVNDKKVEDFSLTKYAYDVIADSADFKVVLADKNGIEYPVNVDYNGNTAAFRIGEKEYTVNCTFEDGYSLENIVIKIDVDRDGDAEASLESNAFTEVVEGKNYQYRYLLDEDETKIPKVTAYLFNRADSSKPLLEVKNVVQATQLPDCAIVTLRNKEYMIRFANNGDWTTISTELPDIFNEEKGIYEVEYEEGYFRDYTKTMMMKLFVCAGGKEAAYKFDEALELIKQIDNVTAGVDKIIYLVGWQSDGHDTGYPNWCEVNPRLKCTNCDHEDALECLQWLMDEAWKYNTTVSFHLNASDIYSDNELGQLYVKNDLLHEVDGEPAPDKFWSTGVAYRANHWNDWHSGFFADRVDDFYEFLGKNSDGEYRLAKAGTVHSDAYQLHGSEQATLLQDAQGRAAQIRYWHSKGVDLTTEAIFNHHKKWNNDQASTVPGAFIKHDTWVDSSSNVNNIVESIVGIMPCAWKSMRGLSFYMRYPASVITTSYPNGSSAAKVNFLFGSSSRGEEFFTKNDTIAFPEGWDTSFATDFATSTAISFYMFQFDREELVNSNKVIHSEGLISDWGNKKVYFDGTDIVLRDNNDIFVPMVWEEDAVLAYAATDWTDREWTFTPDWTDETYTSVDLYVNTKDGRTFLKTVDVVNGKVALSAEAGQTLIIKPHLVEEKPPAGNGGGTGSSSSSSSKGESSKKEEATHVETVYAPSTSASTASVATGDGAPLGVLITVMALAAAGIAFVVVKRRKRA